MNVLDSQSGIASAGSGIPSGKSRPSRLKLIFSTFDLRKTDILLPLLVISLTAIGIISVSSAAPALRSRQILGFMLALTAMVLALIPDYHALLHLGPAGYAVTLVLLEAVLLYGTARDDAVRWIEIGGVLFQPTELAKILLILFYAQFIMKHKDKMSGLVCTAASFALILPPVYLIAREPDLSTLIMVFLIFCVMIFVGGISWKFVLTVLGLAVPSGIVVFSLILREGQTIIEDFQRRRILAWLYPEQYPDTAYQTLNSIMAIGSGQLTGKGYNTNGISSLLNSGYISEAQTDLIFTVIGEEFGFIGTTAVVLLITAIAVRCLVIALHADDIAGTVIAAGVGGWVGFQGFMNIGVVTGILPNTGIPLPFVSYGLTSLVSLYMGIGLVLNVHMRSASDLNTGMFR